MAFGEFHHIVEMLNYQDHSLKEKRM